MAISSEAPRTPTTESSDSSRKDRSLVDSDLTELILQQRKEIHDLQAEIARLRAMLGPDALARTAGSSDAVEDDAATLRAALRAVWKKLDSARS